MRSFFVEAAVLATLIPKCFALAIRSEADDSSAVVLPEDLEDEVIFWGDKHNRVHFAAEGQHEEIEMMIRSLGIYDDAIEERAIKKNGTALSSSVSASRPAQTASRNATSIANATTAAGTPSATTIAPIEVNINKVASSSYPPGAATMKSIITPSIVQISLLGAPTHNPAMQYIAGQTNIPVPTLPSKLMGAAATVESGLATKKINKNTGTLQVTNKNKANLTPLSIKPSYSRDMGKGGTIGSNSFFIFADTLSYGPANGNTPGVFTGAASNSVAMDKGMLPAQGKALQLMDPIGAYATQNGFLRGFVPFTQGESYHNQKGKGRIAIWPESSIIPYTGNSGLQFAPIVMINGTGYYFAGTSLSSISVPGQGGPVADRIATRIFDTSSGVEWGCLGGMRSYSSDGLTGGNVYIFGSHKGGLMIGRAPVGTVTKANTYTYWTGNGDNWSSIQPPKASTTNTFIGGQFSTVDIVYSPRHLTFIAVYMNAYTDNTFYAKYLNAPKPILPQWAGGDEADIVQFVTQYPWSTQILVFQQPAPSKGYNYGGGMNIGYFGADDISRGGNKMLLHWTHPTNEDAGSADTGFELQSAVVTWS